MGHKVESNAKEELGICRKTIQERHTKRTPPARWKVENNSVRT